MLVVNDLLALAIAFFGANLLYKSDQIAKHGLIMFLAMAPIYVTIATMNRTFATDVLQRPRFGTARAIQALAVTASFVVFLAYFSKTTGEFSRIIFAMGLGLAIVLLPLTRGILGGSMRGLLKGGAYDVVVIRDAVDYEAVSDERVLNLSSTGFNPEASDPLNLKTLSTLLAGVDEVIVACPNERYASWSMVLKGLTIKSSILAEDDDLGIIEIGHHGQQRTMVVNVGGLTTADRILKRLVDLAGSIMALVALSPVFVACIIAIKLDSKGPVFFRQDRIGRDNILFSMFKFRSMYTDQSDGNASKLTSRTDSRVTRVGRFLRSTSLDELPQLLNVLRGEMSIVGPRPHALGARAAELLYWDADPRYRNRHVIKPGMTGLAQVRGFRGNTEHVHDLTNRLEADLEYAANWSFLNDFHIMVRTLMVLRHSNAY